jgi:hypothetical protein
MVEKVEAEEVEEGKMERKNAKRKEKRTTLPWLLLLPWVCHRSQSSTSLGTESPL